MTKRATYFILLVGLALIACVSYDRSETLLTPAEDPPSTIAVQGEPSATDSLAESTPATIAVPQVIVKTDSELYRLGESVVVTMENNTSSPMQFTEICSLHLCFESGEEWVCEERECGGPVTVLEPGSRLEVIHEAKSIALAEATDTTSRYKLDYQIGSEAPYYFAHSNAFTVQGAGMSCKRARQIALEHAQSGPSWNDIDASRATVQWQGENGTCMVDFAGNRAEQIRAGLWSEGYYVIVNAKSGRVIEANAYER